MSKDKSKKALLFGVFDGLHEGHKYFLSEAIKRCADLTVVVATDDSVISLKNKKPKHSQDERIQALKDFHDSLNVLIGDRELGSWKVLLDNKPDIVFLGHDQQGIASELEKLKIPFEYIRAYKPEKFKSSLLK